MLLEGQETGHAEDRGQRRSVCEGRETSRGYWRRKVGKDANGALTIGTGSRISRAGAHRLAKRCSGHPERHTAQTGTGPGDTRGSHFHMHPWTGSTHDRGWATLGWKGRETRHGDTEMGRDTDLGGDSTRQGEIHSWQETAIRRPRNEEKGKTGEVGRSRLQPDRALGA